jgi:hypothetical protein
MSDETTPHDPAPDAGHEAPEPPAAAMPEPPEAAPAAEPTQPAIPAGGPAPAELGWGTQPAGALPPAATATMDPPPAPPAQPVAVAAEPPSERRWSTRQGVLVALLVLLLGLGGGFAIGRATDSGGGGDSLSNASARDLLQQLERNGGLQQALRDLFGRLGNGNGNGRNLFPFPGNGNNNGGNNGNGNGNGNNGNNGNGNPTPTPTTGSAFLGVQIGATGNGQGVEVQAVESGSPAADAGLKQGDVITAIDGTSVNSPAALSSAIRSHQPGDSVRITYTRGGTSADAQVRLGNRASATTTPTAPPA